MSRALTKTEARKTVRITPERHRALRQAAIDRDSNLIEIADEVIDAGIRALREVKQGEPSPCAN